MARNKVNQTNIDNSDPANYPNGRIKNNTGGGDGTPVNEVTKGDIHEFFDKLMRLYGINHNGLPDNTTNGYELVDAARALASKNDFILPLTTAAGVLNVPVKLGKLLNDESIILKATADKGAETHIKGSLDGTSKVVTYLGSFKANEYVRLINTAASVVLVRMVDSFNLDSAVTDLNYLKKASQAEEDAGALDTKSTTPLVNKAAFIKRVNGADSENYLAIPTGAGEKDGLLSHEDKKKIDDFADISSVVQITSATSIEVSSSQGGNLQNNFNFNYVDVFPPAGKTMADLKGFISSNSESWIYGDANDDSWCKHEIRVDKVRVICGCTAPQSPFKVNWLAIWI